MLVEIDRFLRRTGMHPATFGRKAVNDASLVRDLRRGRQLHAQTEEKIRDFIRSNLPA